MIIKTGWKVSKAGSSSGCRFGAGSYFTSTSSKSHDYNSHSEQALGDKTRSMFIAKVAVGNAHIITTAAYSHNAPPAGFTVL